MPIPRGQLRLSQPELNELLTHAHTLRAGTVSPDGWPHVAPLWFLWLDGAVWVNSLRRSRRSRDLAAGSRVAVCIDEGEEYLQLRGAVLYGTFEEAVDGGELARVRAAYGQKYWHGASVPELRSHVWLRLRPDKVVSWDFRKIPSGADKRVEALRETE